jgi:hypothetical protein
MKYHYTRGRNLRTKNKSGEKTKGSNVPKQSDLAVNISVDSLMKHVSEHSGVPLRNNAVDAPNNGDFSSRNAYEDSEKVM